MDAVKTIRNSLPKPSKFWDVKNAADGSVDLFIYGDIIFEEDRWYDTDVSVASLKDALDAAGDVSTINLYVASMGGSFPQALAIYSMLQRHPATVNGHVEGYAASAATLILAVCDTVTAPSNAMLLYHAPLAGIMGYFNAEDLRAVADYLDRFMPQMVATYQNKVPGITADELTELFAEEKWITAQEAADLGFVDTVTAEAMPIAARASKMLETYANVPDDLKAALSMGVEEPELVVEETAQDCEAELADAMRQAEEVAAVRATI